MATFWSPGNILAVVNLLGVVVVLVVAIRRPTEESTNRDTLMAEQIKTLRRDVDTIGVDVKGLRTTVDGFNRGMGQMGSELTRLGTIIDERIPKHAAITHPERRVDPA